MFYFNRKGSYLLKYSLLSLFVLVALVLVFIPAFQADKGTEMLVNQAGGEKGEVELVNKAAEHQSEIVRITHFVVGADLIEKKIESIESLEDVKIRYADWEIAEINNSQIVLKRNVEDIGPECKEGAYFGLSPEGYLTLYKGSQEEKKVIETFFRIDIKGLESGLPQEPVKQLYQGIPIEDLAEFNSVLSTFSEYAVD